MNTRRWIAGRLIRLAHKVYPPRVTVTVGDGPVFNWSDIRLGDRVDLAAEARKYYASHPSGVR